VQKSNKKSSLIDTTFVDAQQALKKMRSIFFSMQQKAVPKVFGIPVMQSGHLRR
jgi:hypothetical protein